MQFTKEQLIEQAKKNIAVLRGAVERIPGASDAAVIHLKLAEITLSALAGMEAEPVAQVLSSRAGNDTSTIDKALPEGTMLYTAPPAPVPVPDEMTPKQASRAYCGEVRGYRDGWNAYRAAMLQGADGALTNEGTKRVGELVMWVKRLAHSLRKANPDSKLQSDAMDYLSRKGLIGVEDILR